MRSRENIFLLALFLSLFFELTIAPFPFIFLISFVFYVVYPAVRTIVFTILAGLLLDILTVSPIGQTPLAILISYLLLDLYKRAFEMKDWRIFLFILLAGTYAYARMLSYSSNLLLFIIVFGVAAILINYFLRGRVLWLK